MTLVDVVNVWMGSVWFGWTHPCPASNALHFAVRVRATFVLLYAVLEPCCVDPLPPVTSSERTHGIYARLVCYNPARVYCATFPAAETRVALTIATAVPSPVGCYPTAPPVYSQPPIPHRLPTLTDVCGWIPRIWTTTLPDHTTTTFTRFLPRCATVTIPPNVPHYPLTIAPTLPAPIPQLVLTSRLTQIHPSHLGHDANTADGLVVRPHRPQHAAFGFAVPTTRVHTA